MIVRDQTSLVYAAKKGAVTGNTRREMAGPGGELLSFRCGRALGSYRGSAEFAMAKPTDGLLHTNADHSK